MTSLALPVGRAGGCLGASGELRSWSLALGSCRSVGSARLRSCLVACAWLLPAWPWLLVRAVRAAFVLGLGLGAWLPFVPWLRAWFLVRAWPWLPQDPAGSGVPVRFRLGRGLRGSGFCTPVDNFSTCAKVRLRLGRLVRAPARLCFPAWSFVAWLGSMDSCLVRFGWRSVLVGAWCRLGSWACG